MNDSNVIVSVCMITYNHEKYISEAIDGVLKQITNFTYELIIAEDCGTDNTRKICLEYQEKFPDKIKLLLPENNLGVLRNFTECIYSANGKYIALCEGDDYWTDPYKLQKQVDLFEKDPDIGLVYTDYDLLNTLSGKINENVIFNSKKQSFEGAGLIKQIFQGKVPIATPTICFRADLLNHIPLNDFVKFKFPIGDWPLFLFLAKYSSLGYVNQSTAIYRKGHESLTNLKSIDKIISKYENEKVMYKYLCDKFVDDLPFDEVGYDIYANNLILGYAFKANDYLNAKKYGSLLFSLGKRNFKIYCSQNELTFKLFCLLKKMKKVYEQ